MKEYKVGEQITLEVKEDPMKQIPCGNCFFANTPMFGSCYSMCEGRIRSDGKNVIFVEKGK